MKKIPKLEANPYSVWYFDGAWKKDPSWVRTEQIGMEILDELRRIYANVVLVKNTYEIIRSAGPA